MFLERAELHGSLADPVLDAMALLNEMATRFPGAVSLAPGWPSEDPFEIDDVSRYLEHYTRYLMTDAGLSASAVRDRLFQYGPGAGTICELIARHLQVDERISVDPKSILVTVGCQEGIAAVLRTLFGRPEQVLLVQSPCYMGVTGAARLWGIDVVAVPEGPAGVEHRAVAEVAARVKSSGRLPRALYLSPDFANPSGATLPVATRRQLLEVAVAEDLLILEDNPYGLYSEVDRQLPTMKSIDDHRQVIYLGTFSKACAPGARVGYVVADQEVRLTDGRRTRLAEEVTRVKGMMSVNTSPIAQGVVGGMLVANGFSLRRASAVRVARVAEQRNVLLTQLQAWLGPARLPAPEVTWSEPAGGFFVVVRLPFVADVAALEDCASRFGVLWTPMSLFYQDGGATEIRLSASRATPAEIETGVHRLAEFVRSRLRPIARAPASGRESYVEMARQEVER